MKIETVDIPVEGGVMEGHLALPASNRGQGIVMLQEIFGINAAMREKAREFAELGFIVLVPDLFWRQEPGVDLGYDEASRAKAFKLFQGFDFAKGVSDIRAAFRYLASRAECEGPPAFLGFCLGGKLAVMAGAAVPQAAAVISLYGVALDQNEKELRALRMPFQFHVGDNDAHISAASIEAVRKITKDMSNAAVFTYPQAQHGFYNRMRGDVFHSEAAQLARSRALAVLGRAGA